MKRYLFKVGVMFYNKDKDHVATVINRTDRTIEYQWKRVDGNPLTGYMSGNTGKCKVSLSEFRNYVKKDAFTILSPLEMELL